MQTLFIRFLQSQREKMQMNYFKKKVILEFMLLIFMQRNFFGQKNPGCPIRVCTKQQKQLYTKYLPYKYEYKVDHLYKKC